MNVREKEILETETAISTLEMLISLNEHDFDRCENGCKNIINSMIRGLKKELKILNNLKNVEL